MIRAFLLILVLSTLSFADTTYTAIPIHNVTGSRVTEYYPEVILPDGTVVGTVYRTSGPINTRDLTEAARFSPETASLDYAPSSLGERRAAGIYHVSPLGDALGFFYDKENKRYQSFIWRSNDSIVIPENTKKSIYSTFSTVLLGLGANDEIFGARAKSNNLTQFNPTPFCDGCNPNISLSDEFPIDMNSSGNFVGAKGNLRKFKKVSAFAYYNDQFFDFSKLLPEEVSKSGVAHDINESNKVLITTGNIGALKNPLIFLVNLENSQVTKISPKYLKNNGGLYVSKQSINKCGQLIYSVSNFNSKKTVEQLQHGFLWNETTGDTDINSLISDKASLRGYKIIKAKAISDSGHVLVEGARTVSRKAAKIRCGCGGGGDKVLYRYFLLSPSQVTTCN